MQFTFGDKREVHLVGESVLLVTEKRRGEGKSNIGPRMKNGHANHKSNCPHTNGRCSEFNLSSLSQYFNLGPMLLFPSPLYRSGKKGSYTTIP